MPCDAMANECDFNLKGLGWIWDGSTRILGLGWDRMATAFDAMRCDAL